MKVLVVGSGGREHAIVWKIAQSKQVEQIYCAPGNAGIAQLATCVPIAATQLEQLAAFALEKQIDLTVVGMDDPLVAGIVDVFEEKGLRIFGPRKNAAILEGSKVFSKRLMQKYQIPTAEYEVFNRAEEAISYLRDTKYPVVIKADGLALGKGVLICQTYEEAKQAVQQIMQEKKFGDAGNQIVIEEYMTGREVSVLAFCDGTHIAVMTSAQDHKRALDGDQGENTGGMGTFSPSPFYTDELDAICQKTIYQPTIAAMQKEGRPFIGVLFFGLMLTEDGPKVLEYNVRFGDPEAQVILPRMKTDLIEVIEACLSGTLDQITLSFEENAAVCVVMASAGYPKKYEIGYPISGLEQFFQKEAYYAFHAGTKQENGQIVTNGGRVLGITAKAQTLQQARTQAYEATKWVYFQDAYQRSDIGASILN